MANRNGAYFEGVYDRLKNVVHLFKEKRTIQLSEEGVFDKQLDDILFHENLANLRDEIELLDGAGNEFDMDLISKGKLSPVFLVLLLLILA